MAPVPKLITRVIYDMLLNRKECGTGNEMFCAQKGIILGRLPDGVQREPKRECGLLAKLKQCRQWHILTVQIVGNEQVWVNCYINVALGATPDLINCRGLHLGNKKQ